MKTFLFTVLAAFILTCAVTLAAGDQAQGLTLQRAIDLIETAGDADKATPLLEEAAAGPDPVVAARALFYLARVQERQDMDLARRTYARIVAEFAGVRDVAAEASRRLAATTPGVAAGPDVARLANANGSGARVSRQQVWTTPAAGGRPSPDGRLVAWVNWSDGGALAIHDLVTGADRNLTDPTEQGFAADPVFSPDGTTIFYGWSDDKDDQWSLRSIGVDGTHRRVIVNDTIVAGPVSPDGTWMAALRVLVAQKGAREIIALKVSDGTWHTLKSVDWRDPQLGNFSPDGRVFVYALRTRPELQDRDVFAMAVDGSSEVKLVSAPGGNRHPFFTPDGRHVAFISNQSGQWDLWAQRVRNGQALGAPQIVHPGIGPVEGAGFARDGRYFYAHQIDQKDAFEVDIDPSTMRAAGPPRRVSDRFTHGSTTPAWSADGRFIAYIATRGQGWLAEGDDVSVAIRDVASQEERELTVPLQFPGLARVSWFPDGRALLIGDVTPTGRRYRRLDLVTGELRVLLETAYSNVTTASLAPDGASFLFTLSDPDDSSKKSVVSYDLVSRVQTPVYSTNYGQGGPPAFHGFAMSPDRRLMSFFKIQPGGGPVRWGLMVSALAGGPAMVWEPNRHVEPLPSVWDRDGRGVFVVTAETATADLREIWWVSRDGAAHAFGVSMPQLVMSSVHPNGNRLGFTGGQGVTEVWTLANLFTEDGR